MDQPYKIEIITDYEESVSPRQGAMRGRLFTNLYFWRGFLFNGLVVNRQGIQDSSNLQ